MDRVKLAELRKKKINQKTTQEKARHSEIIESQNNVAEAVKSLHETLNKQEKYDDSKLISQVEELKKSLVFSKDIEKIEKAIKSIPNEVKVDNFADLIKSVGTLKLGNNNIVKSIKALIDTVEEHTPSQLPENYMPTRRVRRVGTRYIFDDDPMQVNVSGGGVGGSSVPTINGAVPVVNPDGSNISGGGGSGGLTDAELRASPVPVEATLDTTGLATEANQQTDALTNAELRASPVEVTGDFASDGLTDTELRATPVAVTVSGVATSSKQDTQQTALDAIKTALEILDNIVAGSEAQVDVISSALPTGAATSANQQTDALTDVELRASPLEVDTGLTTQTDALTNTQLRAADVKITLDGETVPVSGTFWQATQPVSGTVSVTGVSTAANQTTGNTSLSNIDTKTPALGQALAAASTPVVLPAAQITTLTPQTNALTDTQLRATPVPVSGTVTTGGLTDAQLRASDVKITLDGESVPVTGTFWQATQPISGTVTADLGALNGAATSAKQDSLLAELQLKADLTETQPVSLASVPSHPVTNAGTFAVQATQATVASATLSNVASSATNVTLIASNANRRQAMIFNDSTQSLYVKFGATASATSFTVRIAAGGYYEFPQPVYTGIVDGLWASAQGSARITEL